MTTYFQKAYTVAVALNNMGVTLMERGCYQHAMGALADAISIMKEISVASQDPQAVTCQRSLHSYAAFESKLSKARSNIFSSQPLDAKIASAANNFCVVTEEGCGTIIAPALLRGQIFTTRVTFLIRIELEGKSIQECECREPHLESACILQNFANAHASMSTVCTDPAQARLGLENAFKLFELAYSVLQNEESEPDTVTTIAQVLPIMIMVLRSLVLLSSALRRDTEEEGYHADIINMGEVFLETAIPETMTAAAAAA